MGLDVDEYKDLINSVQNEEVRENLKLFIEGVDYTFIICENTFNMFNIPLLYFSKEIEQLSDYVYVQIHRWSIDVKHNGIKTTHKVGFGDVTKVVTHVNDVIRGWYE